MSGEVDVQQIHHGAIAVDRGQAAVLTTYRIDSDCISAFYFFIFVLYKYLVKIIFIMGKLTDER